MPGGDSLEGPGLAISRAFGDHYIKDFGLISEPELTHRRLTSKDQFAILATDGVSSIVPAMNSRNIRKTCLKTILSS